MTDQKTIQRSLIAVGLGLAILAPPSAAQAETFKITGPTFDGVAIDRCLSWNQDCDWVAAHELCARGGYTRAVDWTWAYKGRTKTLRSGEVCTAGPGVECGGFLDVTCARGPGVLPPEPPVPVTPPEPTGPGVSDLSDIGDPFEMPNTGDTGGLFDTGDTPVITDTPGPAWTPPATFTGAIGDYTIDTDPTTGDWIVTDIRPGSPGGTVRITAETPYLLFADGTLPGPGSGADPTGTTTGGMTEDQVEDAYDGTDFAPADDSQGSGVILARLTRSAHNCYETGPSPSRKYTHCDLSYSLTNTSTENVRWTSGEWETQQEDGDGMDRRGVGYGAAMIKPGETIELNTWCIIPTGELRGTWAAWGSGQYPESGVRSQFTWRLTAICP